MLDKNAKTQPAKLPAPLKDLLNNLPEGLINFVKNTLIRKLSPAVQQNAMDMGIDIFTLGTPEQIERFINLHTEVKKNKI